MYNDKFTRIHCGACRKVVKYKERVFLDDLNTVIHQWCYTPSYTIKDRGTFKEIVNRYEFFEEVRLT